MEWLRANGAPDGVDRSRYQELQGKPPETPEPCKKRRAIYRNSGGGP